ncbi:hypothetical protein Ssi02_43180 [Sinosporangium siamense]|uniref:AB hydrolase-1 domain-containing protein n=1 Tax=Sinosporangium siamense TaxID=1367973 RepID=A0A919RHX4_9ACTN|nr:alpha/beta fold hydrolase [Sinosporangium siamense]GII94087.1 hypothetical protein Ssi02_43180 [Sinosporangium siamense]
MPSADPNGIFDHLDSAQSIQDLEALRVALGEEKLTFHSSSYGTMLGSQYAETYPRHVRAMVLESVMDHSVARTGTFLETGAAAAQDLFDEFVEWCGSNAGCALHGRDVRAVWKGLLARAESGRLATPPDLVRRLGPTVSSIDLVNAIAFRRFYEGDFTGLAKEIDTMDKSAPVNGPAPRLSPLPPAAPIFCSDWRLPLRDHREYTSLVRRMNAAAPDMPYLLPTPDGGRLHRRADRQPPAPPQADGAPGPARAAVERAARPGDAAPMGRVRRPPVRAEGRAADVQRLGPRQRHQWTLHGEHR